MLSLSADGSRLVYQEGLIESGITAFEFDAAALRASGTPAPVVRGSRRLVNLDVSPDGEWLAYRTNDARQDIYIARTDGSQQRQVTDDDAKDWHPRWSPDSSRLAFYSNASGGYQIWTVNRDGTGRLQLTDAPEGALTLDPVWSPDGTEIAYLETRPEPHAYIIRSDVPYQEQAPRELQLVEDSDSPLAFRASDWSKWSGLIAGHGVVLYSPASGTFDDLRSGGRVSGPRWLGSSRQVYYRRGETWMALDTETGTERPISLPLGSAPAELRLSPDASRAFVLSEDSRADVWMIEIR